MALGDTFCDLTNVLADEHVHTPHTIVVADTATVGVELDVASNPLSLWVEFGDNYNIQVVKEKSRASDPHLLVKAEDIFKATLRLDFAYRQLTERAEGSKRSVSN
eukprot:m.272128 g.272128  ORF g.272128 m.272128 type:complete len:105 (+) comp17674_c2_seq3:1139-1453(+)